MRIVYHSFGGRFSDNPRAIYEALLRDGGQDEHLWLADPDHAGAFPEGVATVPFGTAEAADALGSADLVVANTHTEMAWSKAPGCTLLQTWHGTPLKRIHLDVLWAPPGRLERLSHDVAMWDVLLSPNSFSTPFLRQAFRYGGEVLESGYPRNDVLSAPDRRDRRAEVRRLLGLAPEVTAVLYAPTWRDDAILPGGGRDLDLHLDLDRVAARLGPERALLLRLHPLVTDHMGPLDRPGVIDASRQADIRELYLAADVLVTDYSSAMFDFAVTGRPMLFYTYDLADYRDRLRGFYFDFAPEAPGPLLETEDELVAALLDLPAVASRYRDRLARFRDRFCHLEDGRASERVVARIRAGAPLVR